MQMKLSLLSKRQIKKLYLCLVEEDGSFNQLSEVEVLHRDNIMWERGINFY